MAVRIRRQYLTFLPAQVQGRWFYLYLILDLFSRKVVGFEVHETDSADHAAHLARRTALAEGVHASHALYQQARERNPRRWSGQTRNWTPIAAVTLNPERDAVIQAALVQSQPNTRNRGAT
jgi:transposase InsO family protein